MRSRMNRTINEVKQLVQPAKQLASAEEEIQSSFYKLFQALGSDTLQISCFIDTLQISCFIHIHEVESQSVLVSKCVLADDMHFYSKRYAVFCTNCGNEKRKLTSNQRQNLKKER